MDGGSGQPPSLQAFLGGTEYSLYANDNSIGSVASAINSQYGDKVRAVVVNVGSSTSPDYRLSLQATKLGDLSPDLLDSSVSLQAQQTTGSQAQYIVNGSGNTVSSDSRNVTIATGVTATLLAASASAVNITVTRSTSALSSGLDAFATAYNAAVDEVDHQHGTTSGPLAGQSLISALSQSLSSLSTYSANGTGIHGLADLGLDLDKTGHLTFSSFKLLASDLVNSTGVTVFLGSTTGGGFLKLATDKLTSIQQVGTGLLPSAEAAVQSQITSIQWADQHPTGCGGPHDRPIAGAYGGGRRLDRQHGAAVQLYLRTLQCAADRGQTIWLRRWLPSGPRSNAETSRRRKHCGRLGRMLRRNELRLGA